MPFIVMLVVDGFVFVGETESWIDNKLPLCQDFPRYHC